MTVTLADRGDVRFRVAHASCELQARKALAAATDDPLVLLIDFEGRLALDVSSRLAGGRVRAVTAERRLARLFGARTVSPDLLASPLKQALLADGAAVYPPLAGTTLDLDTAWRKYLERLLLLSADAPLSEERVAAHCAQAGDPQYFRRVLASRPDLREALHTYLQERAGPVARLAFRAWERDAGPEVAAFAFILQAAAPTLGSSEYLQAWLGLRLADLDSDLGNAIRAQRPSLERWGALAERLALQFPEEPALDGILAHAERLLDERLKDALGGSRFLPSAFARTRETLAEALEAAADAPGPAALAVVRERLEAARSHRLGDRESRRQLDRALMAARLCGYLAACKAAPAGPDAELPADVVAALAAEYAREGGFVDRARAAARGVETDRLDGAIAKVLARADAVRDELDERFARALPAWAARRKTDRLVSIDEALDRFAVEFLAGGDHRRLMVLLLDGMAWANAVELLLDLEEQRWGPVRWQPKGASGERLPPMLAALPTVTEVSRAAFFAGKLPGVGEAGATRDDPDRFDGHPGLRPRGGVRGPEPQGPAGSPQRRRPRPPGRAAGRRSRARPR